MSRSVNQRFAELYGEYTSITVYSSDVSRSVLRKTQKLPANLRAHEHRSSSAQCNNGMVAHAPVQHGHVRCDEDENANPKQYPKPVHLVILRKERAESPVDRTEDNGVRHGLDEEARARRESQEKAGGEQDEENHRHKDVRVKGGHL